MQKIDLGLTGYDELFMNDAERKENKLPRIYDIPLSEIDDFPDHPFKVKLDEDMDQLVQSIKERGIITPVTLRPKEDGRYEIVSGHRRRKACELAGFDTVKAEVREMTRDEAIILMVESNLQRSVILPSEKAFSYKMRLEAMNRQGQRTDLTSVPVAQKSTSRELLGKEVGESQDQVRRYIRLTELIPELLDLVDEGRIAFRPAVELSYRGFDMELSFDTFSREYKISLIHQLRHTVTLGTDIFGNIQRLDNTLGAFEERMAACAEQLENTRVQLENAKAEVQKPFPQEEELKTKSARLNELNAMLNLDKREN